MISFPILDLVLSHCGNFAVITLGSYHHVTFYNFKIWHLLDSGTQSTVRGADARCIPGWIGQNRVLATSGRKARHCFLTAHSRRAECKSMTDTHLTVALMTLCQREES
jgi:hypothetical protein